MLCRFLNGGSEVGFLIPQKVRLSRASYAFVIDSEVELVKPAFTTMTDCRSFFLLVIPLQKMCKNPHVASFFSGSSMQECRSVCAQQHSYHTKHVSPASPDGKWPLSANHRIDHHTKAPVVTSLAVMTNH